jgi:hypothetical protein
MKLRAEFFPEDFDASAKLAGCWLVSTSQSSFRKQNLCKLSVVGSASRWKHQVSTSVYICVRDARMDFKGSIQFFPKDNSRALTLRNFYSLSFRYMIKECGDTPAPCNPHIYVQLYTTHPDETLSYSCRFRLTNGNPVHTSADHEWHEFYVDRDSPAILGSQGTYGSAACVNGPLNSQPTGVQDFDAFTHNPDRVFIAVYFGSTNDNNQNGMGVYFDHFLLVTQQFPDGPSEPSELVYEFMDFEPK